MARFIRAVAVATFGILVLVAMPAPASAHAYLAASSPADGAVLDRAPEVLTLSFTEHVELSSARIDVVDGDGRHWAVRSMALRTADDGGPQVAQAAGTESPVSLVAGLPTLPPNTYHVSWRTLSSDDLHTTSGTLVFGVQRQVGAAARPAGPAAPGPREAAARAIGLLGLAVLLGGAALALVQAVATRRAPRRTIDPLLRGRLLRVAAYGGVVALSATPVQLFIQLSGAGTSWRALVVDQLTSARWLLREIGVGALVVAVLLAARTLRTPPPATDPTATDPTATDPTATGPTADERAADERAIDERAGGGSSGWYRWALLVLGAVGAVTAAIGTALLGHPIGDPTSTVLVGAGHVLAAGCWAGGVLAAALALLPVLRSGPDRSGQVRDMLHAFAVLAISCVTVLTVTGLLLTGAQVATVDALLTTPYGLLLVAKVTLVGVAGLLGLRTARRLRRGAGVPRRGLATEAVVLAGVLVLAGSLAAAGPARGPRFPVASPGRVASEVSGQAADLVDTVTVRPNRPGRNVVSVTISDTRRPAPGAVTGVSVMLTGPDGVRTVHPVTRTGDGWAVTVDDIRSPGEWRVSITVLRDSLPAVTDAHPWTVPAAGANPASVVVSSAPLRPAATWAAALLGLAAAGAALLFGLRRRATRRRPDPGQSPAPRLDPGPPPDGAGAPADEGPAADAPADAGASQAVDRPEESTVTGELTSAR